MLTRQRQLGGQIAPGITLFIPCVFILFHHVSTINDQSTPARGEKKMRSKQLINYTFTATLNANSTVIKATVNYFGHRYERLTN